MSEVKEVIKKLKYELHMYHGAEFETPLNIIEQALERLEAIKNVNGGEALELFNKLIHIEMVKGVNNFILKSQQQAKELEEIKKTAIWALKNAIHMNNALPHPSASDDFIFNEKLKKLVGDSDE